MKSDAARTTTSNDVKYSPVSKEIILVAGHADCIVRGPQFVHAPVTIAKKTSAWEVLIYLSMVLETDEGMSTLARFAPPVLAIREPGKSGEDDWIVLDGLIEHRSRYVAIYEQLKQASIVTQNFDEAMEAPVWGVCMVDVVASMQNPCLADLKIGFLRHSPHTPPGKMARIQRKRVKQPNAIRLCGALHYVCCDDKMVLEKCGKQLGYQMETEEELIEFFRAFFSSVRRIGSTDASLSSSSDDRLVKLRLGLCFKRVQELYVFFTSSIGASLLEKNAFVSTSIFIAYDAECDDNVSVYLIDYCRSSDRRLNFSEEEVGFVSGLRNLVRVLSCVYANHD